MSTGMDTDLAALLAALRSADGAGAEQPRLAPAAGETVGDWLSQLSAARAAADAGAVRHRLRVDEEADRLFGERLTDLIAIPEGALGHGVETVSVPPREQLIDVVPALRGIAAAGPAPAPGVIVQDTVTVRVTAPAHPTSGIVRLHGGAFWMGGGEVSSRIDSTLIDHVALTANAAVFDVDYRLAPEHPYPAAVVDALHVLDAVRTGLGGFALSEFALMGTSSGANTATIAARADGLRTDHRPIAALSLIVPSVLLSDGPPALRRDPEAWRTRLDQLRCYLGPDVGADDPWVSPAVEEALAGMPPTFAAIAAYDEVATGGERLCAAITAGGGSARFRAYPMTHTTAVPAVEAAVIRDTAGFLADRLHAAP